MKDKKTRLFDFLPPGFFSILASKNKEVYVQALIILHENLLNDEMIIKKDEYLRTLRDSSEIVEMLDLASEEESQEIEEERLFPSIASKASFIIRRLEETGWIDIELDPQTFEEHIALPSYSIKMLNLLMELIQGSDLHYNSLVHSTYSELKLEDEEKDELMYATLLRAYENTKKLRVELITLSHSIRIYQNRLGKIFNTNDVLEDYFDQYKEKISDRLYHPLKTFDSVAKFKRPIISIVQKWLQNEDIRKQLIAQAMIYVRNKTKEEIEIDLIEKVNYITDMYDQITNLLSDIDIKHSEYTKASASKIIYLNNSDKTIKGSLETIFKAYAKANISGHGLGTILSQMQNSVNLYKIGFIDPQSITLPVIRNIRYDDTPLQILDIGDVDSLLMADFLAKTKDLYTNERIFGFMQTAFGDSLELAIQDIPLPTFEAFILLILATVYKDHSECFYTLKIEEGRLEYAGYIIPNITFYRKVNQKHV